MTGAVNDPCPRCRASRWRTLLKGEAWKCRACGWIRQAAPDGNP